jgi:hypothetical protein
MTDTGLSLSITPSSTNSKVLVLVSQAGVCSRNGNGWSGAIQIVRGSTAIFGGTPSYEYQSVISGLSPTKYEMRGRFNMVYLDSPATTSATTYKTQARIEVVVNDDKWIMQDGSANSSITLMEIGA